MGAKKYSTDLCVLCVTFRLVSLRVSGEPIDLPFAFTGDAEANKLLGRTYRKPFVLPDV